MVCKSIQRYFVTCGSTEAQIGEPEVQVLRNWTRHHKYVHSDQSYQSHVGSSPKSHSIPCETDKTRHETAFFDTVVESTMRKLVQ